MAPQVHEQIDVQVNQEVTEYWRTEAYTLEKINEEQKKRIKSELDRKNMAQKELADLIHISPEGLSRIMSGKVGFSRDRAHEIAQALDVRTEYITGEDDCRDYDELMILMEKDEDELKSEIIAEEMACNNFFVHGLESLGYEISVFYCDSDEPTPIKHRRGQRISSEAIFDLSVPIRYEISGGGEKTRGVSGDKWVILSDKATDIVKSLIKQLPEYVYFARLRALPQADDLFVDSSFEELPF